MRYPGEISREDYAAHEGVNWSTLANMRKSPLHYKHGLEHARKETSAMRKGSALHTLVFEPETYAERFTVYRESKNNGEGSKRKWLAFQGQARSAGQTILDESEEATAHAMADAIRKSGAAQYIAPSRGRAEIPLTWTDAETGIICKARLDWVTLTDCPLDLKSTRNAELRAFGRQAWHFGYFHQAAFYRAGLATALGKDPSKLPFVIIAVESEAPHDVAVFEPGDEDMYAAEIEVKALLATLADCRRANKWAGRYQGAQILKAPAYVLMSDDEEWQTTVTTQEG